MKGTALDQKLAEKAIGNTTVVVRRGGCRKTASPIYSTKSMRIQWVFGSQEWISRMKHPRFPNLAGPLVRSREAITF